MRLIETLIWPVALVLITALVVSAFLLYGAPMCRFACGEKGVERFIPDRVTRGVEQCECRP